MGYQGRVVAPRIKSMLAIARTRVQKRIVTFNFLSFQLVQFAMSLETGQI
jgi:hypothetical protein